MKSDGLRKLVMAALLAALCCLLTMVVQIPSPMSGYVNLGDCVVLLAGWVLGPLYGAAAAGIGSLLADALAGYIVYAPATLVIKAAMAMVAGLCWNVAAPPRRMKPLAARALGAVAAEGLMVLGYFLYACLLMGQGLAAAASIPGNLVQGVVGIAAGLGIFGLLAKSKAFTSKQ